MERELILTGVGGQGIQLAAQVLARAAVLEGRHVLMLGTYGGNMRGGNTDCTLVVGDAPIASPPIVSRAGSAIALHHRFWEPVRRRLRPGALVLLNAGVFDAEVDRGALRVFDVPATAMADGLGSALAASLVLVGFYAALTGVARDASLVAAMRESLPPYRRQHAPLNEKALRAGFDAAPQGGEAAAAGAAQ